MAFEEGILWEVLTAKEAAALWGVAAVFG